MDIDHIFIFTNDNGKVADELAAFGLQEGSNRIHKGQGTRNRKFYFENFFLEILWVHDEAELNSFPVRETGLWERANHRITHFSPFGLCLVNTPETESIFGNALHYQPAYFPEGLYIDVLANNNDPDLPWAFRLPFTERQSHAGEPISHRTGLAQLTQAVFSCKNINRVFVNNFAADKTIVFKKSDKIWLDLTFDHGRQAQKIDFETVKLSLHY